MDKSTLQTFAIIVTIAGAAWVVRGAISDNSVAIEANVAGIEANVATIEANVAIIEANAIAIDKLSVKIEANAAAIAELRDIVWSHSHAPVVTSDNN